MTPSDPSDQDLPTLDPDDFSDLTDPGLDLQSLLEEEEVQDEKDAVNTDDPTPSSPNTKVPSFGARSAKSTPSPRAVRFSPKTINTRTQRSKTIQETSPPEISPLPQTEESVQNIEEPTPIPEEISPKTIQNETILSPVATQKPQEGVFEEERQTREEYLAAEARFLQENSQEEISPQVVEEDLEVLLPAENDSLQEAGIEETILQEDSIEETILQEDSIEEPLQEDSIEEPLQEDSIEEPLQEEQLIPSEESEEILQEDSPEETISSQEEQGTEESRSLKTEEQITVSSQEKSSWRNTHDRFKEEIQNLVKERDWKTIAQKTKGALEEDWARFSEIRASLLLDLARLYQDRLEDSQGALHSFQLLLEIDPANREAIRYLDTALEEAEDWKSLHQVYAHAIEAVWEPKYRLDWTQKAAGIAMEKLSDPELATSDWERLWRLGDATQESLIELNRSYRAFGRWESLAEFLSERSKHLEGTNRLLALRELGELYLSALQDHEKAAPVFAEILAIRPEDNLARLAWARVLVRRQDFAALEELAGSAEPLGDSSSLDLLRLIADALWQSGEKERSVGVYNRILRSIPTDKDSQKAKESFLEETQQYEALCEFLEDRAEQSKDIEKKVSLLEKAAMYAEQELVDLPRAAKLLGRAIALTPRKEKLHANLSEIYESLGDLEGVARALEGQLDVTSALEPRILLLRRLGEHYAHRLGNDEKAEVFWREILKVVRRDDQVEDELLALHRRRGQFEDLDSALLRQIWQTEEPSRALSKAREAAQFCTEVLENPKRSLEAWSRLLDLAPDDPEALQALVSYWETHGNSRDLIAALEAGLRVSNDQRKKIDNTIAIAKHWEEAGAKFLALASYERTLSDTPTSPDALAGLFRLRNSEEAGAAISALDVASICVQDPQERISILKGAQSLLPENAHTARFAIARRILWLNPSPSEEFLQELSNLSEKAEAHEELIAAYTRLAAKAESQETLLRYRKSIAHIAQHKLHTPSRAFLEFVSLGLQASSLVSVTDSFVELAEATGRYEDLLTIWESMAVPSFSEEQRRKAITARANICEQKLNDSERAFWEWRRILEIDASDPSARAQLHRLAEENALWRQLDDVYGELWDSVEEIEQRISLMRTRYQIRQEHLKNPLAAIDTLATIFRISPEKEDLRNELLENAETSGAWGRVLPLLEGVERSKEEVDPDALAKLATFYEEKCSDLEHAFVLYQEAFANDPESLTLEEHVLRLAEETKSYERLGEALRRVASLSMDNQRALSLYRRVARIYETNLQAPERAIEVHRRILRLDENSIESLDVLIKFQRERKEWQELRELLRQWIKIAPEQESRIKPWLEIAALSQTHLDDIEGALSALSAVLDLDPENQEAEAQMQNITENNTDPSLELKRLRIDLGRAKGEKQKTLFLEMAKVQEELGQKDQAIETLQRFQEEAGVLNPGVSTLERLYKECSRFSDLAKLLEERASSEEELSKQIEFLEQAKTVREEHTSSEIALEGLYRKLLALKEGDVEAHTKLAAILRKTGRYQELADLLSTLPPTIDTETRLALQRERARILRSLGQKEEAEVVFSEVLRKMPEDTTSLLTLSLTKFEAKEIEEYIKLRRQQAKTLPPKAAAFVFCHLAELSDDIAKPPAQISAFYREARQIDADNELATEALKSLGRRAKGWRKNASLLPDPDEKELDKSTRALRLYTRGKEADKNEEAILWYWKAVAVDPSLIEAWDALVTQLQEKDKKYSCAASFSALAAYEATIDPAPEKNREHAERVFQLSKAVETVYGESQARVLAQNAHRIDPMYGPVMVLVADDALDRNEINKAYHFYDQALEQSDTILEDSLRLHATYRRGILARQQEFRERALEDLRETLRTEPLHADALATLAEIFTEEGRYGAAAQHHIQALLIEKEPKERGKRYFALGCLLEDHLDSPEEAGASYDLSLSLGVSERDLISRALRYYQQAGNREQALQTLEHLLETTKEPKELSNLWTIRGQLEIEQQKAIEAFDMALSYEPGRKEALAGVAKILEEREEWEQLLDIYEARLEGGNTEERAEALRQMAKIASTSMEDPERAEAYLQELFALNPNRDDLQKLLALYGEDPLRRNDRRNILGRLVSFGPPWYTQALDFAKLLYEDGENAWAWAIISPMSQMAFPEASLKAALQELRKNFDKKDNLEALHRNLHKELRTPEEDPDLSWVLEQLDPNLPSWGWQTPEDAGAESFARIDERTSAGRLFRQVSTQLGIEESTSVRAQELSLPLFVLCGEQYQVLVRAEILQSLSSNDLSFVWGMGLDLSAPGRRLLVGCSAIDREILLPALFAALGLETLESPLAERAAHWISQIQENVEEEIRLIWADRLRAFAGKSQELGQQQYEGILKTARRVGAVAAGDLRMASRAISRLYESESIKPQGFAKVSELEAHLEKAPVLREALAFVCTHLFRDHLL